MLEALEDAGIATRRPIEVVAWTNEEGNRFQPGAMGSAVFAGLLRSRRRCSASTTGRRDRVAEALAETLAAAPATMRDSELGFPLDGYIEAHIEQGPVLEATGNTIGVVTLIQGYAPLLRRRCVGEEAHSGTTPRRVRKDALTAAVSMVARWSR